MTATTRAASRRSQTPQSELVSSASPSRRTSPTKSNGSPSDGEGRLRPTRKQLAKTSINAAEDTPKTADPTEDHNSTNLTAAPQKSSTNGSRGRGVRRKRSHEELGEEQENGNGTEIATKHLRKRSKDVRGEKRDESASVASISEESEAAHSGDEDATIMISPSKVEPVAVEEDRSTTPIDINEGKKQPVVDVKKSPPNKRNRDQFTEDHATPEGQEPDKTTPAETTAEATTNAGRSALAVKGNDQAPDSKRHRDSFIGASTTEESTETAAKVPPSSGFANFAAQSPFAALARPKSPATKPQTSSSAFASSGFAALANSSQSPFGALSPSQKASDALSPSAFGSAAPASGFAALGDSTKSPFASTGQSVFGGSQSSGFGQLGNGFGSTSSFGGPLNKPLSSFAAPAVPSIIGAGSKSAKPFGVLGDEDEEDGDASEVEQDVESKAVGADKDQRDERFYEQEVETGEEDERTEFKGRGKLYMMGTDKQWKERGTGDFKVNSKKAENKTTARFLMRVDGSHRVVLNSPIKKDLLVEDPQRGPPRGRTAVFLGFVEDQIVTLQLKMRDNVQTLALHDAVKRLQKLM